MLGLAVHLGHLKIIKFLVTECSVSVNGEQSVNVSPAISGVCGHTLLDTGHLPFSWIQFMVTKQKKPQTTLRLHLFTGINFLFFFCHCIPCKPQNLILVRI